MSKELLEEYDNFMKKWRGIVDNRLDRLEKKLEGVTEDIQNIHLSLIKEGVDMERVDQLEHDVQKLKETAD